LPVSALIATTSPSSPERVALQGGLFMNVM
jgi:hypothetical protein